MDAGLASLVRDGEGNVHVDEALCSTGMCLLAGVTEYGTLLITGMVYTEGAETKQRTGPEARMRWQPPRKYICRRRREKARRKT